MNKQIMLKKGNVKYLIIYCFWCIALYSAFQTVPQDLLLNIQKIMKELKSANGIYVFLSPLIVFVLLGVVNSNNKARIVFWKWRYALPGHRAFSALAHNDPRIDLKLLKNISSNLKAH